MNPDPDLGFSAPASASGSDQPEKSPFQDLYPEISFITAGTGIGTVLFFIVLQILQNLT
jgi:hypothetical protein